MRWGRKQTVKQSANTRTDTVAYTARWNAARAVCILGTVSCLLFFCTLVGAERRDVSFPPSVSEAAAVSFLVEHASFADALSIGEYFTLPAVSVSSFSTRGEEAYLSFIGEAESPWTFYDYLKEALRTLMGLS